MARNRASMREGPLAELFRATEAAQRQGEGTEKPPEEAPPPAVEPEHPQERTVEHVPDFVAEAREEPQAAAVAPVAPPEPEAAAPAAPPEVAPEPAAPRERPYEPPRSFLEPLPEPAPRLEYATPRDSTSYLAVIRVVGVGGAGLNAVNRMIDAGGRRCVRRRLLRALGLPLGGFGRAEELGERALTHARAVSRHRAPPSPGRGTPRRPGRTGRIS